MICYVIGIQVSRLLTMWLAVLHAAYFNRTLVSDKLTDCRFVNLIALTLAEDDA